MKLSKSVLDKLNAITDKRPSIVIQHILKYGFITTEDLKEKYGYEHPPRAARDVRERGVNLLTYKVKSSDGRNIAAYKFGKPVFLDDKVSKKAGRTALSKALKKALVEKNGAICFVYLQPMPEGLLQVDHRIPYEIGGENEGNDIDCYMLLSPSANRAKSWTCEHCSNWNLHDVNFCKSCFWAYPEEYTHIAGRKERQIIVTFTDNEIEDYNRLIELVGIDRAERTIKDMISEFIQTNNDK